MKLENNLKAEKSEDYDMDELREMTCKLKEKTAAALREINMYENFMQDGDFQKYVSDLKQAEQLKIAKAAKTRLHDVDRYVKLTYEQKAFIALAITDSLRNSIANLQKESERQIEEYNVLKEEANIRYGITTQRLNEFKRKVLPDSEDKRKEHPSADEFVRFQSEVMKKNEATFEKLRLNNAVLRERLKKLRDNLILKEDRDDSINQVDVEQIKVQNKEALAKLKENCRVINQYKNLATKILHLFDSEKEKLNEMLKEKAMIEMEIQRREQSKLKTDKEMNAVNLDVMTETELLDKLAETVSEYRVPELYDYIRLKREESYLSRKEKCYERKKKIAESTMKSHQRQLRKLTRHTNE